MIKYPDCFIQLYLDQPDGINIDHTIFRYLLHPNHRRTITLSKEINLTENKPIIQTHKLSKAFEDDVALKDLDLTVPEHSITGFLGPNGAGKSTTIRLLLGLIEPTVGCGKIFDLDIQGQSPQIRRRVGYLAQSPRFYQEMTAREVLSFTARFFYSGPKAAIDERVAEMLAMVSLEDKADRAVKGFSGA